MSIKGKAAIVGIGEFPTGRFPETSGLEIALKSIRQAIEDSGIKKDEIDTIITTGALYSSAFETELTTGKLVEELGLGGKVKSNLQVFSGGSSSCSHLKVATGLLETGVAKNVLCVHADKLGTGVDLQQALDIFATAGISDEWEIPYGMNFSAVAGLTMQRYMYETGTTPEQLASVCVSNRKWAELNPNAMYRKPLTVEEVLTSKMIASPLHAKESNVLLDGGSAFVMTSSERAKDLTEKPVYILGEGSRVSHCLISSAPDLVRFSWDEAAKDAYREAGLTPMDIDVAEIYDSYAVYQLMALEALGLCPRGEAGAFVAAGHTMPGGKMPVTTNGGMLSQGHTGAGGGFAVLIEAVRQLMGKAGERQVNDAKFSVYTGTGGTYMDAQVTMLGNIIP